MRYIELPPAPFLGVLKQWIKAAGLAPLIKKALSALETNKTLSCHDLQGSLELGIEQMHLCAYLFNTPEGKTKGSVAAGRLENDFPIDLLIAARKRLNDQNAAGIENECTGCPNLIKRRWARNKYPVTSMTINSWTACNLECQYCYTITSADFIKEQVKGYELTPLIMNMINNKYLAPDALITWGGGDVAALKGFSDVAQLLYDYGTSQEIKTNATVFSKFIEDHIALDRIRVEVSLDAGTRETYAIVKGRDLFDEAWNNLQRYIDKGGAQKISLKYIMRFNNNSDIEIDAFVCRCLGVDFNSIKVTPDSLEIFHPDKFTEYTQRQCAKLIARLQSTGHRVYPREREEFGAVFHQYGQAVHGFFIDIQ